MGDAIPSEVVEAICAVMADVESVKKSQRNAHGGYDYASTDDIYAAVARKMGNAGLVCISLELSTEVVTKEGKDKAQTWLKVVYKFILATKAASYTSDGLIRTVMVPITGPQSFQAAQSYAEKQFLRSLFKLPTGDKDLDSFPEDFKYANIFSTAEPPAAPQAGQIDKEILSDLIRRIRAALTHASTHEAIMNTIETFAPEIDRVLSGTTAKDQEMIDILNNIVNSAVGQDTYSWKAPE
jgi:hypothetical protein